MYIVCIYIPNDSNVHLSAGRLELLQNHCPVCDVTRLQALAHCHPEKSYCERDRTATYHAIVGAMGPSAGQLWNAWASLGSIGVEALGGFTGVVLVVLAMVVVVVSLPAAVMLPLQPVEPWKKM
jgi:hypothetical protein